MQDPVVEIGFWVLLSLGTVLLFVGSLEGESDSSRDKLLTAIAMFLLAIALKIS